MEYRISVDLSELLDGIHSAINKEVLPTLHQAVYALADETAYRWKDAVSKAKLSLQEKQAYVQSISFSMTADFSAEVVATYDQAEAIESGRPGFDMKRALQTSKKVRYVKNGKHAGMRYLIIPFRHSTPGYTAHGQDMPAHVYAQAKGLRPSKVTGSTLKHNGGTGARARMVKRATYEWGGKLPAGLTPKLKPHHTTDIHAQMYRFNTSSGGQKSSAYMTFRTMGEWQGQKWIRKPEPGLFIAKKITAEIEAEAPKVFAEAMRRLT